MLTSFLSRAIGGYDCSVTLSFRVQASSVFCEMLRPRIQPINRSFNGEKQVMRSEINCIFEGVFFCKRYGGNNHCVKGIDRSCALKDFSTILPDPMEVSQRIFPLPPIAKVVSYPRP